MMELKNYYELIPESYKHIKITYNNQKNININVPFRMLIVGTSGSFKSNTLINIISLLGCFTRFFLYTPDIEEPLYSCLRDTFNNIGDKYERVIFTSSNDIREIPKLEEFDQKEQNLVIIDDMITQKDLSYVYDLFTRGRKKNISVIFISQSYFKCPKLIRGNSNLLIIKKVNELNDISRIIRENGGDEDAKIVQDLYKYCMNRDKLNFFLIDKETMDDNLKYRCNFQGFTKIQPEHFLF